VEDGVPDVGGVPAPADVDAVPWLDVSVKRSYSSARREAQARETRRSILGAAHQLIERTIAGDDDPLPITERTAAQSVAAEPDARRRAELDAALGRSIIERIAPSCGSRQKQPPPIPSWPR